MSKPVYVAHHPDGTVEHLIYEYEEDLIRDFMNTPNVTVIKVHGESVEVLNADMCQWETATKEYG